MDDTQTFLNKILKSDSGTRTELVKSLQGSTVSEWLKLPDWKSRNAAVKIVGELDIREFTGDLLDMMTDRTPAHFLDRILGGDYYQVGFIRRNAARVLGKIASPEQDVAAAMQKALDDPYWEVRVEALKSCRKIFAGKLPDSLMSAAIARLRDRKFEVTAEAVRALGESAADDKIIRDFKPLYEHPNSLVRVAVIDALTLLHKRGLIREISALHNEINDIFIPGEYSFRRNNL